MIGMARNHIDAHAYGNASFAANIIPPEVVCYSNNVYHHSLRAIGLIITLFYFIFDYFTTHIFVTLINKDYKRHLSKKTSAILLELF